MLIHLLLIIFSIFSIIFCIFKLDFFTLFWSIMMIDWKKI